MCNVYLLGAWACTVYSLVYMSWTWHFNSFSVSITYYCIIGCSFVLFEPRSPLSVTLVGRLPSQTFPLPSHRPRPSTGSFIYLRLKIARLKMHEWVITLTPAYRFLTCRSFSLCVWKQWTWREMWILVHCSQRYEAGGGGGRWVRELDRHKQGGRERAGEQVHLLQ